MSSGGEPRVSIPSSFCKTIQNIKEIAGNHSDEEVYAMLKECGMDPNEATQRLLLQDVSQIHFMWSKESRYKRKENIGNKEVPDAGWRPGGLGRGGRGSRGSYSSRFIPNDATGAKNLPVAKEMGANQIADKASKSSFTVQGAESKGRHMKLGSASGIANGDIKMTCGESHSLESSQSENLASPKADINSEHPVPIVEAHEKSIPSTKESSSTVVVLDSDVSASASNSFKDIPYTVAIIKRDIGGQHSVADMKSEIMPSETAGMGLQPSLEATIDSNSGISQFQGKLPSKPHRLGANHLTEVPMVESAATVPSSSESRPSSNYNNRSQPLIGQQKVSVGPSKEWKPKQLKPDLVKDVPSIGASESIPPVSETGSHLLPSVDVNVLEDSTSKAQKKLGELHLFDRGHVIFPNHIRVPDAERAGLSFGSFDANFGQKSNSEYETDGDKGSIVESVQDVEENAEEAPLSPQIASAEVEEDATFDHSQPPEQMPEALSSEDVNISSTISTEREFGQPKPGANSVPVVTTSQYSVIQTVPTYSTFGLMAPVFGGQIAPFENPESQVRDASRIPGTVVQQPIDLSTNYYTQLYRASADGDDRASPVAVPSSAAKYNGQPTVLSTHTDQTTQESGNSPVQPTSGPASVGNQGAGVMQSSLAVQQPVSIFRQPTGLHISHYPPNFIPYSQYYSPFYLPPPSIHPFLGNPAFPQQHPAGSIYPPPMSPAAAPIKFSLSQFKAGGNSGNPVHAGSTGFGLYSSNLSNYNPTPATSVGNSTGNEDLAAQYKENNMYLAGQQSEGPAMWIPAPGRDISGLQPSSFYNISPQGQHLAFTPMQPGHAAFPGIYHPTQTGTASPVHPLLQQSQAVAGAVEMVAPPTGVYQQPQRAQINWANNY